MACAHSGAMSEKPILNVGEFYAHALAIEHEAVRRYREFEAYFAGRGDDVLAGLCRNLADMEGEHLRALTRATESMRLPSIDASRHDWLAPGSSSAAHEAFYRVVEARQLLEIALRSECDAMGFFEWVAHTTADPGVRALATEMAGEEMDHVKWVRNAIEYARAGDRRA